MSRLVEALSSIVGQESCLSRPEELFVYECDGLTLDPSRPALVVLPASTDEVAAVSCGVHDGAAVLDLDYAEDSAAAVDANFVLTGAGGIVEIQGTAEEKPMTETIFLDLLALAKGGVAELIALQRQALGL